MNRREFLNTLRTQLSGHMHDGKIAANLRYYEDYIQSHVQRGESESSVIASLGDPRLIAKTLIDTDADSDNSENYTDHYRSYEQEYGTSCSDTTGKITHHLFGRDTWYFRILSMLLFVLILYIALRIFTALVPFLLIFGLILFIFRLIDRPRK